MKKELLICSLVFSALANTAFGQGTFIYDQQTGDETNLQIAGGAGIHEIPSLAQTFTPSLNAVGFVRFHITDGDFSDSLGTTAFVQLRSGSVNGSLLASSVPVALSNAFFGTVDFMFGANIAVTPGNTYFLGLLRTGGSDTFTANISFYNYAGGTLYLGGTPDISDRDMWFREGIVVPEPSPLVLFLAGGSIVSWCVRHKRRKVITHSC